MKQLDEKLLLSLGFIKDGSLNLSPDFYLNKNKIYITVNLKETSDKKCGIEIIDPKNPDFFIKFRTVTMFKPKILYLEQLNYIVRMIFCTGLPISKEILERNGYKVVVDGSDMASKYKNKNFKCLTSKNFYVKAYNSSYSIIIKLPQIYCSHLDLVYKILGEENKRIW